MNGKRLRSRRQRAFAILLLFVACGLVWALLGIVLLRSIQPSVHLPI